MKWILMIPVMILLTGCLGRASLSDLSTGTGAVITAGAATAVGLPATAVAASTALGATAGAVLVEEPETTADALEKLPEEERASALKWKVFWEFIESLGYYAFLIVAGLIFIPMLMGYFMPNGKQRKMQRMMFDDPKIKSKDMK